MATYKGDAMAKHKAAESDEARLKKKIAEKRAGSGNSKEHAAIRALRKRLKREQRRRRALALRKKHAVGTKTEAATPTSA
jgi:hypothetical protein